LTGVDHAAHPEMDVAGKLAGEPVLHMSRVGGGRNSRVFRLETANDVFALKQYPSLRDDPRDRLGVETRALRWMEKHRLGGVPRVIATDPTSNSALLSWVEGSLVRSVVASDIDQAADFLTALARLVGATDFPASHLAAEACLSGVEIERQLRTRVAALRQLEDEPDLSAFLTGEFGGALESRLAAARSLFSEAGLSFETELNQAQRTLVPSDFGFHNSLRDENGRLSFVDFEYFGWDDPAKLTADILLHPGTPVAAGLLARFQAAAERLYGGDPDFATRLGAFYPLFGLRWVLILLNEFHPERWSRRILAGAGESWAEAKSRQLRAARAMLVSSKARGKLQ
jgi:Phosphotransferase enzyme family